MSCCCGTDLGSFISRSLLHVEILLSIITQGSAADHNTGLRVGGRTTDCFSHAFGHIALHNSLIFLRVDLSLDILLKGGSFQSKSALKRELNSWTLTRNLNLKFISICVYSLVEYKRSISFLVLFLFLFAAPEAAHFRLLWAGWDQSASFGAPAILWRPANTFIWGLISTVWIRWERRGACSFLIRWRALWWRRRGRWGGGGVSAG